MRDHVAIAAALLALTACSSTPEQQPTELVPYLASVAAMDVATRTREVESWKLDEPAWRALVVDPYRDLHADYARAFAARLPAIVDRLPTLGSFATRAHYAGDAQLTLGEARARWALPVAFASQVASANGGDLDVVFVRSGDRWRAITGLDTILHARVSALDAACGVVFEMNFPAQRCRELAWQIADAALRGERARFTHACSLAATSCVRSE